MALSLPVSGGHGMTRASRSSLLRASVWLRLRITAIGNLKAVRSPPVSHGLVSQRSAKSSTRSSLARRRVCICCLLCRLEPVLVLHIQWQWSLIPVTVLVSVVRNRLTPTISFMPAYMIASPLATQWPQVTGCRHVPLTTFESMLTNRSSQIRLLSVPQSL